MNFFGIMLCFFFCFFFFSEVVTKPTEKQVDAEIQETLKYPPSLNFTEE